MSLRIILFVALLILPASCADRQPTSSLDEKAAIAEIDLLRSQFEQAVASGDLAALGALVSPEAIIIQPGAADWKAMQNIAAGAPFSQQAKIHITPVETKVVSGEWAFERGASVVTYMNPETGGEIMLRDSYLLIFRNEGQGWKVYREVASASAPPEGWSALEKD